MPYRDTLDSGQKESLEQNYRRERKAAFQSAQLALDAMTDENEAIVLAILSLSHQTRMAALDIAEQIEGLRR